MIVKTFGRRDSRTGDHSYSGWTEYYKVCNGSCHLEVTVPCGVLDGRTHISKNEPCDDLCSAGTECEAAEMPQVVQEALGISVFVPEGKVLVLTDWNGRIGSQSSDWWWVKNAGEAVTPAELKKGTLLSEGESVKKGESKNYRGGSYEAYTVIKNQGGKAVFLPDPSKKEFAREVWRKLEEDGFPRGAIRAIMKAAGPGMALQAVEWAKDALLAISEWGCNDGIQTATGVDALSVVLKGAGGKNNFGIERQDAALLALGLPASYGSNSGQGFRCLAGALEALPAIKKILSSTAEDKKGK